MAQASGASYNKAFFTNVDTQSVFYVQFNPKEFKLDEKANWKASEEQEADKPLLTYEKGEPTTVSMDLIFDSTDSGLNVYDTYVMPLRDFLTSDVEVSDPEGDKATRPPYCKFTWGSFTFDCVIDKVSATFLMFKPDGTPLRAKVQVGLKERLRSVPGGSDPQVMLTALGSMVSGSRTNASTYTSLPGDTTTSIAQRFKANPQDIALANNIADPLEIPPGTRLVIPANSQLAQVLAKQSLQHTPAFWTNDRKLDPFEVPKAKGGSTEYVPSALEEDGPVALDYAVEPGDLANAYISYGNYTGQDSGGSSSVFEGGGGIDYVEYGESDFTFGRTEPQTYGDYGPSEVIGGGGGIEYTEAGPSAAADSFVNEANPVAQGETAQAVGYGGYGASDSAAPDTGGPGGNDVVVGDQANELSTAANPVAQGATAEATSYGGYGDSAQSGELSTSANPVAEGSATEATPYAHHDGSAADALSTTATPGGGGAGGGGGGGAGGGGASGAVPSSGDGGGAGHTSSPGSSDVSSVASPSSSVGMGAASVASSRADAVVKQMKDAEGTTPGGGSGAVAPPSAPGAAPAPGAVASTPTEATGPGGMSLGEVLSRGEQAEDKTDGKK